MADETAKTPCALIVMGVSGSGKSTVGEMLFEAAGADKRAILTRVFDGEDLPANRLRADGETVWLVDQAAMPEHFRGR